eukprot:CAMPEP_0202853734 /NCGR_PEP_ID=MMETSP1389-20130828/90634_1 /ASSEMBLY_ACC=CAM_ASM_000865 /TAXON_ID=302021 /ORGANISM="Rhodomonas sp., Strain CCMP768" /LENGTH=265 /DNA_ID=CAMNT_0049532291 /DNA_START=12 /DNA_END=811 /DNA_ORIENTATION=+
MLMKAVALSLLLAVLPFSTASNCVASDVSIVQDVAYTDMATTWISTERGLLEDKMAVFSAEFRLFCKSDPVKGAPLKVAIVYRSGSEAYVPKEGLGKVAVMANEGGTYQLSFALPEKQMPSGEYKAEIYFEGENSVAASISMFHSVPVIHGRHMEMLSAVLLAVQVYVVSTWFSAAKEAGSRDAAASACSVSFSGDSTFAVAGDGHRQVQWRDFVGRQLSGLQQEIILIDKDEHEGKNGRHMEMLSAVLLAVQVYVVSTWFSAAK